VMFPRGDVTFWPQTGPSEAMESLISFVDSRPSVEALYRADAERLWNALCAFSGDPDIASDAVSEAYAQLLHRGGAVSNPVAWTWRAAFHIAAGALKSRRADAAKQADPVVDGEPRRTDSYGDPDLQEALRRLPDNQRAAVVLFYYLDLPVQQIAARLGTNSLAVRANLSRGRRRLRQLLGDQDG
jgi:RNA polymerase sigma factor (sigma-70 family)